MKPNFLIAGGVATGTSFLSATLSGHPDIYLPKIQRPEPNFFHYTDKYERGLKWYLNEWFSAVSNEKAVGERSSLMLPSYISIGRLKKSFPNIKLIFCLRNPIERAWANYRFTVLEGFESLTFNEALKCESDRKIASVGRWSEIQPYAYVARGMYSKCLLQYIEAFGRDNIHLIKSELLGSDTPKELFHVLNFLGVDNSIQLKTPVNYSSTSVKDLNTQMKLRSYFGDRFPTLVEAIRKEESLKNLISRPEDHHYLMALQNNLEVTKKEMVECDRSYLREVFYQELLDLQKIVDFDISDWR
jgi:hypothetical protein